MGQYIDIHWITLMRNGTFRLISKWTFIVYSSPSRNRVGLFKWNWETNDSKLPINLLLFISALRLYTFVMSNERTRSAFLFAFVFVVFFFVICIFCVSIFIGSIWNNKRNKCHENVALNDLINHKWATMRILYEIIIIFVHMFRIRHFKKKKCHFLLNNPLDQFYSIVVFYSLSCRF